MTELGTLEELPRDYRDALAASNLLPLWPSLRALLPRKIPQRRTQPVLWRYKDARPLVLRAGELTPIEKAERRVASHAATKAREADRRSRPAPAHGSGAPRQRPAPPAPRWGRG